MNLVLADRSLSSTPAKQKAEASAAAGDDDFLSKKLKAEESLAPLMGDDLLSDAKFEDESLSEIHKAEETPADLGDEETSEDSEDEESPEDLEEEEPLPPDTAIEISKEDGWVDEIPYVPKPEREVVIDEEDEADYNFANEEERNNFRLYVQEYVRSEGFDIEHYCNKVMNALMPLNLNQEDKYLVTRDCKRSIIAAIKYKNKVNGWNLELAKVIKSNNVTGSFYYATFDAKDNDIGVVRTYEAQLSRDHFTPKTTIFMFRVKPDAESK